MDITHPALLKYIKNRPELGQLSDWRIIRVERKSHWFEWKTHILRLCVMGSAGNPICIASADNGETEQDLVNDLFSELSPDHDREEESLMLYGAPNNNSTCSAYSIHL